MYKTILLVAMAAALGASMWGADAVESRMDDVMRYYADEAKTFMGSVAVARGGHPVYHKAFGWANREWEVKNVVEGKFRVGSVSKQFTAAAILLLEEEGKLKVEDPVSRYLKDAPPSWEKITIHHLLNHTSGIPNFTAFPDYGDFKRQPHSLQQLYERFRDKPLDFPPGEKWSYSNSGYEAAGLIVEKVSGVEFGDFLRDRVFARAGMKDSGSEKNKPLLEKRVAGYTPGPGGLRNADYIDMSIPVGAGSIYSTTGDLVKWETALFGGKILSEASLKKMTTAYLGGYGYGLQVRKTDGRERFEHAGGIDGFNSFLTYTPGAGVTVAVLSNLNGGAPGEIAAKLLALAQGEKVVLPSERKEVEVSADVIRRYAGTYSWAEGDFVISEEHGKLMVQNGEKGPKRPFAAESESRFFLRQPDVVVEFGQRGMTVTQGGQQIQATKR